MVLKLKEVQSMKSTIVRSPNPDAPEEFGQFAFLAGEWDCERRQLLESGDYAEPTNARLVGTYVLNGYAFQDEMLAPFGLGMGTTWRTYDVEKKQWACRWLQAGTDTSLNFSNDWFCGNFIDGEMRLSGTGRNDKGAYEFRILFSNISDIHFSWMLSHSYDKGKSWIEGVAIIEASRCVDGRN